MSLPLPPAQDSWTHVLRAVSRYEHLHALGGGFNDATMFFSEGAVQEPEQAAAAKQRPGLQAFKFGLGGALGAGLGANPLAGLTPNKRQHKSSGSLGGSGVGSPGPADGSAGGSADVPEFVPPPQWVLDSLSPEELSSKVFLRTHQMEAEAVVSFVRALCVVSLEELEARCPRVYTLAKIVEIAHFNMDRIRLVWGRIWNVLSEFFITVGLLRNLRVAMYVIDSLRQLSMKFLARDELTNYTFQNDFLKPYVVIMRQSQELSIRELIIRCMSQMVLARVGNIKSGWKSMFMARALGRAFSPVPGDRARASLHEPGAAPVLPR